MTEQPTPDLIMQTGMGFMASKTLLSAVELELFTILGDRSMMAPEIGDRLGLHPRATSAGFVRTEVVPLAGPTSAAMACKA